MRRHKKKTLNVLIIEDEAAPRQLLQMMLRKARGVKYVVKECEDLSMAYLLLGDEEYRPDVIILDLNLKDSEGIQTFRALTMRYPRIAVLIHTGISDRALSDEVIELGADYIVKGGINPHNLDLRIRNAILAKENSLLISEREAHYQKSEAVAQAMLERAPQIITACASCAKVKDLTLDPDDNDSMSQWVSLVFYLSMHGIELSHGLCPDCMGETIDGIVKESLGDAESGQANPKPT